MLWCLLRHSAALRRRGLYEQRMSGPACGPSCPPTPGTSPKAAARPSSSPSTEKTCNVAPEALGVLRGAVPCDPKRFLPPDDICPIASCGS